MQQRRLGTSSLEVSAIGLGGSLRRLGVEAIDRYHQHRVDPQVRCRGLRRWAARGRT